MSGQVQLRVGDVASIIRVTVKDAGVALNLSTATVKQLKLKKPSGTVVVKDAIFATDGVNGQLQYETLAGDLDVPGPWMVQVYIEMGTQKFHTTMFSLPVSANLS